MINSLKNKKISKALKRFIALLVIVVIVSSCIPNEKVIYSQNKDGDPALDLDVLITPPRSEYYLQPRDILAINFFSNVDSEVEPFKQSTSDVLVPLGGGQQGGQQGSQQAGRQGQPFVIDNNGFLLVNTLEPVMVVGKTAEQLKFLLENKIREDKGIKDISVNVSLAGIRFTTMGELGVGQQVIAGSEATILEAIAAAGDLSINADRQNIQILRSYDGGVKWHEIDITRRDLMLTEFWYVKPGDVIYAPPLKLREIGAGDNLLSQLGTVITLISAVVFFASLTNN